MKNKYDVCIVGLKCLDNLRRCESPRYLGGIERQLTVLGRLFAESGLSVCFITYDDGGPAVERIDGIDVIKSYDPNSGIPGIRFIFPRFFRLFRAVRYARARIVLQMGAGVESGVSALASRSPGRISKFVFFAASDGDCLEDNPFITKWRERHMFRFGLKNADTVVVQTERQALLMQENFGSSTNVQHLPAVVDGSEGESTARRLERLERETKARILWVGRIVKEKRPEWVLHAANCHPHIQFDVVGDANSATQYAADFKRRAAELPNIVLHGKLGDKHLQGLFRTATLLLCTSELEGFPTTFLEAWAFAVPVVTSFDPDNVVRENGLGYTFESVDELSDTIEKCVEISNQKDLSRRVLQFFHSKYSPAATLPSVIRLLAFEA